LIFTFFKTNTQTFWTPSIATFFLPLSGCFSASLFFACAVVARSRGFSTPDYRSTRPSLDFSANPLSGYLGRWCNCQQTVVLSVSLLRSGCWLIGWIICWA
jgi:hypothetical protein